MDIQYQRGLFIVFAIIGFFGIGWFYTNQIPKPEPVEEILHGIYKIEEVKKPQRGFMWEDKAGVDYWEIYLSQGVNPEIAELKAIVTEPTATCEDVQVCGKARYIHVRSIEKGIASEFATLHWPAL